MIEVVEHDGGAHLDVALRPGSVAFADADWLAAPGRVPAIVVTDGRISWDGGETVELPLGLPPEAAAAALLAALAERACEASGGAAHPVDVLGGGAVAACVRALLRAKAAPEEQPAAIVDTTGDPERIAAATRRLAPLGTLVLTGEPAGRTLALDLYPDVHARGLRVVGVPRPLLGEAQPRDLPEPLLDRPVEISGGAPIVPGAAGWYRIVPRDVLS
jgi:hypothetical protein